MGRSVPGAAAAQDISEHFYLQADDGIRDRNVTGVQTCALPIYFKPLVFRKVGRVMNLRQLIPALFSLSLALTAAASAWIPGARFAFFGIVGAYAAAVLGCAFHTAHRHGAACGAAAAAVFPTLHVSYGLGFIRGVWDHTVRRHRRRAAVAVLPQTAGRQAAAVQPRDS